MSDPLPEYVIALTFSSRASSPYEVRGEAMASNMAHGITPEVVSRFRRAILEARKIPDLSAQLYQRKDKVHERVFPGYMNRQSRKYAYLKADADVPHGRVMEILGLMNKLDVGSVGMVVDPNVQARQ